MAQRIVCLERLLPEEAGPSHAEGLEDIFLGKVLQLSAGNGFHDHLQQDQPFPRISIFRPGGEKYFELLIIAGIEFPPSWEIPSYGTGSDGP